MLIHVNMVIISTQLKCPIDHYLGTACKPHILHCKTLPEQKTSSVLEIVHFLILKKRILSCFFWSVGKRERCSWVLVAVIFSRWERTGSAHSFGEKVDKWQRKKLRCFSVRWETPGGNRREPLITTVSWWSICMDELQTDNELVLRFFPFLSHAVSSPPPKQVSHHWESSCLYRTAWQINALFQNQGKRLLSISMGFNSLLYLSPSSFKAKQTFLFPTLPN